MIKTEEAWKHYNEYQKLYQKIKYDSSAEYRLRVLTRQKNHYHTKKEFMRLSHILLN